MLFEFSDEYFGQNTVAAVISGKHFQDDRCGNNLPVKFTAAGGITLWLRETLLGHGRMMRVKAINQRNLMIVFAQKSAQIKKSEGFYPEIIRGKIVNPGID